MEENKDLGLAQNVDNNVAFDYNRLYDNMGTQNQVPQQEEPIPFDTPVTQQTPIVFEDNRQEQQTVVPNTLSSFNTNTLRTDENKNWDLNQNMDSNDVTFDYDKLYQNMTGQNQAPQQEEPTPFIAPDIEQTPIVFEDNKQEIVSDIIPTFDTNALEEDLPEELRPKVEEPLIQSMASEAQQAKKEERQNLLFIIIFFAVLIVAVVVVFPLLAGI